MANDNKLVTLADLKEAFDNLNQNKKTVQTAVSDPTASGTDVSFIYSISQDAQGVITATKKTVAEATTSAAGLMSAADKTKLNGIEAGAEVNAVTSVNGATGAVVLDAEDVGAVAVGADTSDVTIQQSPSLNFPVQILLHGNLGRYIFSISQNGDIYLYDEDLGRDIWTLNTPVRVNQGGTGATTPAGACAALAPGIPTSNYDTGIIWTSTTATFDSNNGVRCIKYGNGLKRIFGLFSVSGSGVAEGGLMFSVPIDYQYLDNNNGSIQGWGSITKYSGGASYMFRFIGRDVLSWGSAVPEGVYVINYLYF